MTNQDKRNTCRCNTLIHISVRVFFKVNMLISFLFNPPKRNNFPESHLQI